MNANQLTSENGIVQFIVHTVNTNEVPANCIKIDANIRNSKSQQVAEDQRYRNIVIPEFSLPNIEDKFRVVLITKFEELAKARFEGEMKENRSAKTVLASNYTIDSLLEFFSTQATSNRLTAAAIEEWFKNSETRKFIISRKDETTADKYGKLYAKVASPNHGINPPTCTALIAAIQTGDLEAESTTVVEAITSRLQATIDRANKSEVDML